MPTTPTPIVQRTPTAAPAFRFLSHALLWGIILSGFAARWWISAHSLGSNDWEAWRHFGHWIGQNGLLEMYRADPRLNHPPLAALWAMWAKRIAESWGWSFPMVFRLPVLAADLGACILLGRIWGRRRGWLAGLGVAALYAWSPTAILVGAYHCNTDNLAVALALLAVYFIAERRNFSAGGLALAAAINVKLIPVLLIPPLLGLCRDWRDARRFVISLSLGAIPFIPVLLGVGGSFYRNALSYNPLADRWGICLLFEAMQYWTFPPQWRGWETFAWDNFDWYHAHARNFILMASGGLGLLAWTARRWRPTRRFAWNAYEMAALTTAFFLVLTGGFGVQYLVYAAPLLLATSVWSGFFYNLLAGAFLFVIYAHWWNGLTPYYSGFGGPARMPAPLVGMIAWWILVEFILRTLFFRKAAQCPPAPNARTDTV